MVFCCVCVASHRHAFNHPDKNPDNHNYNIPRLDKLNMFKHV
jgi:hypothetical protein